MYNQVSVKQKSVSDQDLINHLKSLNQILNRICNDANNFVVGSSTYNKQNYSWIFQCKRIVHSVNIELMNMNNKSNSKIIKSHIENTIQFSSKILVLLIKYEFDLAKQKNVDVNYLFNELMR